MNPTRAKRLTRIATGLAHVREDDLLLVAEVVEDLAIKAARLPTVPWDVTPEMKATRNVLAEVTRG